MPRGYDRGSHGGAHARPRVDNYDGKTVGIARCESACPSVRWTAVLPVVTLVIGSLGTLFLDERRDKRALDRAKAERRAAREESVSQRREAFELAHLLAVHAALRETWVSLPSALEQGLPTRCGVRGGLQGSWTQWFGDIHKGSVTRR